MKILLVDDDFNKIRQIREFVEAEYPTLELQQKNSFQSGLKEIMVSPPDLLLLDMSMPTYDVVGKETGGRERRYAGKEMIRRMVRRKVPTKVIVITQFERFGEGSELTTLEQLRSELEDSYASVYVGTVFYQASDIRWRYDLKRLMSEVLG